MPNINIIVREKIAQAVGDTHIVCGNSDYIAVFDFDEEWDAYETKTARFIWNGKYTDVVFTGTKCPVPVITGAFGVLVGVYAGDLHTTTAATVDTEKSILCRNGLPADPPPDVYAQIIAQLNGMASPEWKDIQDKPFAALGDGLTVDEENKLSVSDKINAPQTAAVGEVLTVEEVDADGKPKKWKTQAMDVADVVKFTEQDLTGEQRAQARKNISVVGGKELNGLGELEIGSDTSFCVVNEYDTTASNLGLTPDEFPMLIIKSAHIWYGRQDFYALSKTGKLYNGVVGNDIQTWNEMTKRIVVNVSRTEEESGAAVMSADKTYREIDDAIKSNCDVALNFDGNVFTWSQTVKNGNYSTYVFQRTDVQHSRILSIGITGTSAGKTVVQQQTHSTPILMTNENTPPTGSVVTWIKSGYGLVSIEELLYYIPVHSILIKSSTEGSTKKFRITVDDSGTLTATELV